MGLSQNEYMLKADVWPLNKNGEVMLGVKIETLWQRRMRRRPRGYQALRSPNGVLVTRASFFSALQAVSGATAVASPSRHAKGSCARLQGGQGCELLLPELIGRDDLHQRRYAPGRERPSVFEAAGHMVE